MPIPISESIEALKARVEFVLQRELPVYCAARSSTDYPIPAPTERSYIIGRTGSLDGASEHLGNPDVFVMVFLGPSDLLDASANQALYNQATPITVAIILRRSIGATLPGTAGGRELMMEEWMEARAEKYRGILQDICAKHLCDGDNISQVTLEGAGVSDPINEDSGIYREAGIRFEALQHVAVQTPTYQD